MRADIPCQPTWCQGFVSAVRSGIVTGLAMRLRSHSHEPAMTRSGLILALYGGMGLLALMVSAGRGDPDIYRIEGVSTPSRLILSLVIGAALGLAVVGLSRIAVRRFAWARGLHTSFKDLLGPLAHRELVVIALASSIGEELLFRGALQPLVGIWLQALVFAALHVGPGRRFLPWTLSAFVLGLLFGAIHLVTGDL